MFTVKYVNKQIMYEQVFAATGVSFNAPVEGGPHQLTTVTANLPDGATREFTFGDIYVMNDNGKTVADYHLKSNYAECPQTLN